MGGCASKPKEFETRRDAAPVEEEPAKAGESVATDDAATDKEKSNVGESSDQSQDEAPLVDLSKPEEDDHEKETKATAAEAVPALLVLPGEAEMVVENPKGETVEVEVAAKEGEIIFVEAVKETKKEEDKKDQPKTNASEELLVKV